VQSLWSGYRIDRSFFHRWTARRQGLAWQGSLGLAWPGKASLGMAGTAPDRRTDDRGELAFDLAADACYHVATKRRQNAPIRAYSSSGGSPKNRGSRPGE